MSWVFLTEGRAYKLKKPVKYPTLDFGTLKARELNCREEIRLNRRLAPDVYLGVVRLTRARDGTLVLNGSGQTVDWLVERHDLNLSVEESWTGLGHRHPRLHAPVNRSGEALMGMLLRACERVGADVVAGAKVSGLFADESSNVVGGAAATDAPKCQSDRATATNAPRPTRARQSRDGARGSVTASRLRCRPASSSRAAGRSPGDSRRAGRRPSPRRRA